ncbi:MAG: hypothetical protein JW917_09600 [Ignavibacteria bacterium]|nr:hypothetical protein [Ignavibacteria bacterium]
MKNKYLNYFLLFLIPFLIFGISGCEKIKDTINTITFIILIIAIFGIYFFFKVIGFVLNATKLYKTIIQREEEIIRILLEIRDSKIRF